MKNEASYIQEWLAFHLHSGVEHLYLYLNEDDEGTATALRPFVDVRVYVQFEIPVSRLKLCGCVFVAQSYLEWST